MAFIGIHKSQINEHECTGFIDIYLPIAGHKAIKYWWNDEDKTLGGFWEPWETDICAFRTAKAWAEADDLPYIVHPELE